MNNQTSAVLTGISFGLWPLLMSRSGLNGVISSVIYSFAVALILLPFSFGLWRNLSGVSWIYAISSCIIGAFGLLVFNGMLSKASQAEVGSLSILMILVQTMIPAVYQMIQDGRVSMSKICGFVLFCISSKLLLSGK